MKQTTLFIKMWYAIYILAYLHLKVSFSFCYDGLISDVSKRSLVIRIRLNSFILMIRPITIILFAFNKICIRVL